MDDGNLTHCIVIENLFCQSVHLRYRHRLIGFIIQELGPASSSVVADDALKSNNSSVFGLPQLLHDCFCLNGLADDLTIKTCSRCDLTPCSSADGRKQRYFVAFAKQVRDLSVLLVY